MLLKILSYNIHKGFDWKNQHYFLEEIKEFIESCHADIVFLQEVVGKNTKHEKRGRIDDQFEYLAGELWPHYSYGKNAVYDHGHHGNVILSKFPIESFENLNLSTNPLEQRGLLLCKIVLPKSKDSEQKFFYAASSHLNLLQIGRAKQYERIKKYLLTKNIDAKTPLIIGGDFNDWNKKSKSLFEDDLGMKEVHMSLHGKFAKTFPAFLPFLCLDRIYVKNLKINNAHVHKPKKIFRPFTHLSDHLPLFCEVELIPNL